MGLAAEIAALRALRPGEDFALFAVGDEWTAEFVNPTGCVMLGETSGSFSGSGSTPEEAVHNCANDVRNYWPADRLAHWQMRERIERNSRMPDEEVMASGDTELILSLLAGDFDFEDEVA